MLPSVLPTESDHVPVLADEVVALLDPRPGETVIDCTFGAGGHADLLARRLNGDGKLIAIDRDPTVAPYFERFRREHGVKARLLHGEFSTGPEPARRERRARRRRPDRPRRVVDADRPARRGFSYAVDAPLDMRMDPSAPLSARELVNEARRARAGRHLPHVRRGALRAPDRPRDRAAAQQQPFERTGELVEVIKAAIPAPARFGEGHPAKRVFQALRIEVNDELGALERGAPAALEMLRPGGRLGVISFHSLEDRIVKRFLRASEHGCTCPPDFPVCVCGSKPALRATPRRAIRPSAAEVARNPRAQSARLRVGDEGGWLMATWTHAQPAVAEPVARPRPSRRRRAGQGPRARAHAAASSGSRSAGFCSRASSS